MPPHPGDNAGGQTVLLHGSKTVRKKWGIDTRTACLCIMAVCLIKWHWLC